MSLVVLSFLASAVVRLGIYVFGLQTIPVFVLVHREQIVTDDVPRLEVSAAMKITRVVSAAGPVVDGGFRKWAERTRTRRGRAGAALSKNLIRSNAVLDPVHQRQERIDSRRAHTAAQRAGAMADAGHHEEPIPAL